MLPLLLACTQPAPEDAVTIDSAAAALCEVGLNISPLPNTAEHFYRDPIQVWFTDDPGELDIHLALDGAEVPGTLALEDTQATFTPDAPLSPSQEYSLLVDYCGGEVSAVFSVSDIGRPVDPETLVGRTWVFDLMSGDFLEPDASGVVSAFTLGEGYLFSVLSADESALMLRGGRASYDGGWSQNRCAPTVDLDLPLDFTDNPFASLAADPITIGWMDMMEGSLSGAFSEDGATVAGLQFSGSITVTDMSQSISDWDLTKAEACGLLEGFGLPCVECPDGSGPYCITYDLVDVTAAEAAPLEARTKAEVALDPECLGQ